MKVIVRDQSVIQISAFVVPPNNLFNFGQFLLNTPKFAKRVAQCISEIADVF